MSSVSARHVSFLWRTLPVLETAEVEQSHSQDVNVGKPTTPLQCSILADILIDFAGLGDLHATQAQRIAYCAQQDGLTCPMIAKMAQLGHTGKYTGNVERDFHRSFLQPSMDTLNFNLVPHSAPIPFHNEDNHGRIIDHLDLLAPHETFAQLHAQGPAVFAATVLGRKAEYLETFWQGALQSQTPWVLQHPGLADAANRRWAVPIFLHADEAEPFNGEFFYIFSWSSLATGNPWTCKHLIGVMRSKHMVHERRRNLSLDAVFRFVAWSLNQLHLGVWPSSDQDWPRARPAKTLPGNVVAGTRLAGQFFGVFAGVKGDQHFFVDAFAFTRHFGCIKLCRQCNATKRVGDMLWTDLTGSNRWQQTVGDFEQVVSPLTDTTGWHPSMVHDDLLHVLFVQGSASWACGSALFLLAQHRLFGNRDGAQATLDDQLKIGWLTFRAWAKDRGAAFTASQWSCNAIHRNTNDVYPWLGGKAADVRLTVFFLADFMTTLARDIGQIPDGCAWLPLAASMFSYLATFLHTNWTADLIMTPKQACNVSVSCALGCYAGSARQTSHA